MEKKECAHKHTFGIMSSINVCPPNPGSTVITKAISICPAHGANSSTVVPGLIARPTWKLFFLLAYSYTRGKNKQTNKILIKKKQYIYTGIFLTVIYFFATHTISIILFHNIIIYWDVTVLYFFKHLHENVMFFLPLWIKSNLILISRHLEQPDFSMLYMCRLVNT